MGEAYTQYINKGVALTSCQAYKLPPLCKNYCDSTTSYTYFLAQLRYGRSQYALPAYNTVAMQNDIMTYGPITAAFYVYNDFFSYSSGVYRHVSGAFAGGHAIKIIGWGVEGGVPYWLCANSWGTGWGIGGLFKIRRGYNECYIESWGMIAGFPK